MIIIVNCLQACLGAYVALHDKTSLIFTDLYAIFLDIFACLHLFKTMSS